MNINEFKQKYSYLIAEYLEEYPNRFTFWKNNFTSGFLDYLQQRNIKITYKYPKVLIPKCYNHISEFWLKFLQGHFYFTKKRVTEDYIHKFNSPKNEQVIIKRDFTDLIGYFLKYGIIERFSRDTFKFNKKMVSQYRKNY